MMDRFRLCGRLAAGVLLLVCSGAPLAASPLASGSTAIPGDAEVLLDPAADPLVKVLTNNKYNSQRQLIPTSQHVANPAGAVSGWNIKDLRFRYLSDSDTMIVAVNTVGIAGDADGNGIQGVASPATVAAGGKEYANLGGQASVTVFFDTNRDGIADVVAGVPAKLPNPLDPRSKLTVPGAGLNGFQVAKINPNETRGEQYAYGSLLAGNMGNLLYDPSKENPDFIFTVKNFSKLPGMTSPYSFGVGAFAGSPDDVVAGEDSVFLQNVLVPQPERVPEPATVLAWSIGIGAAAAWRYRRSRRTPLA